VRAGSTGPDVDEAGMATAKAKMKGAIGGLGWQVDDERERGELEMDVSIEGGGGGGGGGSSTL
jgi:hypothetical protein